MPVSLNVLSFLSKCFYPSRWCVETLIILLFFFPALLCPEYFLPRVCVEANGLVSVGLSAPVCVFLAHSAVFIKHLLCTALPERNKYVLGWQPDLKVFGESSVFEFFH